MYIYYLITNIICTFFVIKFNINIVYHCVKKFWRKKNRSDSKIFFCKCLIYKISAYLVNGEIPKVIWRRFFFIKNTEKSSFFACPKFLLCIFVSNCKS